MTAKKTTTKKTVKKSTKKEPERYIKIVFTNDGVGIQGQNVSTVNHIEAVLALLYSLRSNDPELDTVKTVLNAIDYHRKTFNARQEMLGHLENLRDVLQKARAKMDAEVEKAKKNTKKTTKKK